jgi:hypothetical protein
MAIILYVAMEKEKRRLGRLAEDGPSVSGRHKRTNHTSPLLIKLPHLASPINRVGMGLS